MASMTRGQRRPHSEREKPVSDMSSADRPSGTNATGSQNQGANADEAALDPQSKRAIDFIRMLLGKMSMDAEVSIAPDDGEGGENEIRLEIEGPDAGRIIGKRGQVLEAIQYLTTRVAHRPGEERKHISVDAEGYRARHEDQLSQMARKLAQRVMSGGKVITFDPMSARDRRVVHMALKDITGVRTESNGEGPDRRVQIIPVRATGA